MYVVYEFKLKLMFNFEFISGALLISYKFQKLFYVLIDLNHIV